VSILDIVTVAGTLCALIIAGVSVYRVGIAKGRRLGFAEADHQFNDETQRARYESLYIPLWELFLTRHVTSARAILAPYFWQRLAKALPLFRRLCFRKAIRVLTDRRITREAAEIEFGGQFPYGQIQDLVHTNLSVADQTLMCLVRAVDRANYEDQHAVVEREGNVLSDEEFQLFKHIADQYGSLNARFVPETGTRQTD